VTYPNPHRMSGPIRRTVALPLAVLAALGVSFAAATPAAAEDAPVGYVRLAHLSPDTPKVDVYVSKLGDSSFKEQIFRHVGYGVMSNYLAVPVGTYGIAMRLEGQAPSVPPTLSTQATVEAGGAYTVAGVGKHAVIGLKVFVDDLTRPPADKSKVRVIQASVGAPILDVGLANGEPIATAVTFSSTTDYQVVEPGLWTLQLKPNGSSDVTTLSANLDGGSVYSLLVLDGPNGLRLQLRADARGGETAPDGGVATGAGGTFSTVNPLAMVGVGLVVVMGLLAIALRMRRMASRRS